MLMIGKVLKFSYLKLNMTIKLTIKKIEIKEYKRYSLLKRYNKYGNVH
jgi:hypothetical protein